MLKRIQAGEIDPSFIITHEMPLSEVTTGYELFKNKLDDCVKVTLKPGMSTGRDRPIVAIV
ncbi:MAG TPA: hypothetical protein VFN41_09850 [Candidatus Limnocylindrales bacterium]|nr:hypothetical protein [Candidatus Limnocylindrales bacterium]